MLGQGENHEQSAESKHKFNGLQLGHALLLCHRIASQGRQ